MEKTYLTNELTELEVIILQMFVDELTFQEIAATLDIEISLIERLFTRLKKEWNVKGEVGMCAEVIRRGYFELGYSLRHMYLRYWLESVEISTGLRNCLRYFLDKKSQQNLLKPHVQVGMITKKEFMQIPAAGKIKWMEFNEVRSEYSRKLLELKLNFQSNVDYHEA